MLNLVDKGLAILQVFSFETVAFMTYHLCWLLKNALKHL